VRRSRLAEGSVSHRRLEGPAHAFRYGVFMALLDLDEVPELDRSLRLFGRGRGRRLLSFRDEDHFDGSPHGLRASLEAVVRAAGHEPPGGRVLVLTNCRVLGYVFNPVSFFYCHDEDDRLALVVAEVNNTFGDRHSYVLPVESGYEWRRKKVMHVSPFNRPDAGTYRFTAPPPADRIEIGIDLLRAGTAAVAARLSLVTRPFTDAAIARALVRFPFVTAKVTAAIHWEALRLWWKGAPYFPRPPYEPRAVRGGPA
jgi:DUF1365 family protein